MVCWFLPLMLMTASFLRHGGMPGTSYSVAVAFLVAFWSCGIAGGWFFLMKPRVAVGIEDGSLVVRERWLLGSRSEVCGPPGALRAEVVEVTDSDGVAYFICRVTTPAGRVVRLKESHTRAIVDEALAVLRGVGRSG